MKLVVFLFVIIYFSYVNPVLALNSPPPASGKQFTVLPPGSNLLSDSDCASRVRRTTWEPRTENSTTNRYVPVKGTDYNLEVYHGTDNGIWIGDHPQRANGLLNRVSGSFTGTTDEILQWAACKWGVDEDMARAQAVVESNWYMSAVGDNGESYGILQVRSTSNNPGPYPGSKKSTAFNADYTYARWRICFEGLIDYLAQTGPYVAGDAWGCMGAWYTGNWYGSGGGGSASGAQEYINVVKQQLQQRTWEQWSGVQVTSGPTPSTRPATSVTPSPTRPASSITPNPTIPSGCGQKSHGDANCDGSVDGIDYSIWLNSQCHKTNSSQICSDTRADFSSDGNVDDADYDIWISGENGGTVPTPAVKSPTPANRTGTPTRTPTVSPRPGISSTPGVQSGNRIRWQGKDWYIFGVNAPWYQWGCDFGCGSSGGIIGNAAAIDTRLKSLRDHNIHFVRWWVFPGNPTQITRDSSGTPTGLNQAIYADFDRLLAMGETYDLYFNFTLFSSPSNIPSSWETNPTQQQKLAQVLGPLFAHYKNNPRVMTWEVYNEPEWDIQSNKISQSAVVSTAKAIAQSVHANSSALVTVGQAHTDYLGMWIGSGLDYYSPHWYDYMSSGYWCARCQTVDQLRTHIPGLDKPVIIGEFYAGSDTDAAARFSDFYSKGYAGAWAWSLFPEKTSDKMAVNFTAAGAFATQTTDAGPHN